MENEPDDFIGRIAEIELDESAAIIIEQVDDEITLAIASIVGVHFQVTADQALELSRALAVAAENAANFRAAADT
ncbi:hypothetical protein QA649_04500 [Bradyrhizobium sp. CB1717]|uniref:hypothetical protein n=2 Tax=Nitrobacteraceae TaxID=41294 RepID=UPI0024B06F4B|nr:hypothetical protein [Bradyrhizobium sp. CB1717]WFU25506.1 hypothetical protein QA649_04500 [Bradyrhizobium sp. CB1717]